MNCKSSPVFFSPESLSSFSTVGQQHTEKRTSTHRFRMVLPVLRDMNLVEWRQQVYTQMKFIECITLTTERAIIVVAVAVNIENSCTRSSCVFVYVTVEMCSRTRICVESHFTERNFTISLIERHIIFASTFYCIHCSSSPPSRSLSNTPVHVHIALHMHTHSSTYHPFSLVLLAFHRLFIACDQALSLWMDK